MADKKSYYEKNKEERLKYQREYNEKNKEKLKPKQKEWRKNNKKHIKKKQKEWWEKNKKKIHQRRKEERKKNKPLQHRRLYSFSTEDWTYYGSSENLLLRKQIHFSDLKNGIHNNKVMQKWFDDGGKLEDIIFEDLGRGEKIDERQLILSNKCCNQRTPFSADIQKVWEEEGNIAAIKEWNKNKNI